MIQSQLVNHILTVTLDRPEKDNCFTCSMFRLMRDRLKQAANDNDIRVIVIDSRGEHFSLGEDLQDLATSELDYRHPALTFMREFAIFPKPIIANVHGNAFGFGMALLLHCDLIVADANSRFQLPFIRQELMPLFACSSLLPQRLGPQRTAALLLLCEQFTAEQACQWGLINQVCQRQERDLLVEKWSNQLAQLPELLVRQTKQLLSNATAINENILKDEWHLFQENLNIPQLQD